MISFFLKKKELSRSELKNIGLGDEIRKYRNELCYSQEYLAHRLGVTQSTYQRIESGTINITHERLVRIAEVLNLSLDTFLKKNDQTKNDFVSIKINELEQMRKVILLQEQKIEELQKLLNKV